MTAISQPLPAATRPLPKLDFLGRMPIPLRRPFKAGLDQVAAACRRAQGLQLDIRFLGGGEWYSAFDQLAATPAPQLPDMLVTTLYQDMLQPELLAAYRPGPASRQPPVHPVCEAAGLVDPEGTFRLFSVIPFVFLVDEKRLQGRPAPRTWSDLLDPIWVGDIIFGGWRPNESLPYQDFNAYLLAFLHQTFGTAGLQAFAANVRFLQHNIRTASRAGSNSAQAAAIALLPWLQAELCPRRERTRVVWPEDGALAMPIGYLIKAEAEQRLQPLVDYVTGTPLGNLLARNCYPPTRPGIDRAFPAGAELRWNGWEVTRQQDMTLASQQAADLFFDTWYASHPLEQKKCS